MAENSNIEWCDHTFNPWEGCTKVSPGCKHCYAEARNSRWNGGTAPNWGKGKPRRRTSEANWQKPIKWNKEAEPDCHHKNRPRVFCASLADVFDEEVPYEWRMDLFFLIDSTPHLDWLILTKRPQNVMPMLDEISHGNGDLWNLRDQMPNVWLGTSVEDQKRADERIPELLKIPAKVRFLSCEPLLEPVDLGLNNDNYAPYSEDARIDWVIAGGESGPGARPMQLDWVRTIRDECVISKTAFFMKQTGGVRKPFPPIPADLMCREFPLKQGDVV